MPIEWPSLLVHYGALPWYTTLTEKPDTIVQVVGWLGERGAVRAYVAKTERAHYLRLLGGDTHQFEQENKFVKREVNSDAQDVKI